MTIDIHSFLAGAATTVLVAAALGAIVLYGIRWLSKKADEEAAWDDEYDWRK